MSFNDVVAMSPVILIAHVGHDQGTATPFLVERVLKGPTIPFELVPRDQLPVPVRVADRVVLALMHPGISDGSGVTLWIIRADGRLSDAGISDAPTTINALMARLEAPATSTTVSLTREPDGSGPTGGLFIPALAGLIGGVLAWRRFGTDGRPRAKGRPADRVAA